MSAPRSMIVLMSCDGDSFEVEESVAMESQTIKYMIEDDCAEGGIPLPNVTSKSLSKIIEYCKRHAEADKDDEDSLKGFDGEFVKVEVDTLYDLLMAANYLNIKRQLLELIFTTVVDMMKGKKPEEIRKIFNINNDFTPEEEEQVRGENAWAFE